MANRFRQCFGNVAEPKDTLRLVSVTPPNFEAAPLTFLLVQ
ncbi:hypothetical protein NZK35_06930 [Stieleria sp. ICT_E10.1]|nr:hypothetical protein [Stieleria sedimenti]MCS7466407.1 hypothetical protein [Stieleria sedimenti]